MALAVCWGLLAGAPAAQATPRLLDRVVAVVNDDVITLTELEGEVAKLKRQLAAQGTRLPPDEVLRRQVLERMVLTRLQLQRARELGLKVEDADLDRALRDIARRNGLSLEAFRRTLEAQGFDFAEFREDIRREILLARLHRREVGSKVQVSRAEVDRLLAERQAHDEDTEYHLAHILVAVPDGASPEQAAAARRKAERILARLRQGADFRQLAIAESDGQQALEGGDLGWRRADELPSPFVEPVRRLAPGQVSGLIRSPSGFHIVKLLEKRHSGPRHVVTETRLRHILIRPDELTSDEEARRRLEDLRRRILQGEDFAALARQHSQDKATAAAGGELGWVRPGQLDPAFEQAVAGLAPGELSRPFRTPFGWHLVQVEGRRQRDDTEEFLRQQARQGLRRRKEEAELEAWLRRLRDEAHVELRLEEAAPKSAPESGREEENRPAAGAAGKG
ncbi:MAG: molecular chaperone SurA [Gammaproteobacteria bacterium]|nr:MAG: molecular chaperone SurA [Gammaproteobacteria bacterium]